VGGLLSYGNDLLDNVARAASYADRILKGATPNDLPVQAPVKFELVINVKAAKALGLTIPPSLLLRADQVLSEDRAIEGRRAAAQHHVGADRRLAVARRGPST